MKLLLRLVFIAAFCLATVGAAGFPSPREALALPLLVGGLALVALCGVLMRRRRAAEDASGREGASKAQLAAGLADVLARMRRVEAEAGELGGPALADRLDEILGGPCAELGNRNEDYARLLGIADYTRIWDGFATGERLLARAWSMSADGFPHEGRLEIPKARAYFERAVAEAAV